jgi:hypothetical protein
MLPQLTVEPAGCPVRLPSIAADCSSPDGSDISVLLREDHHESLLVACRFPILRSDAGQPKIRV